MMEIFQKLSLWALVDIFIIAVIIYSLLLLIRGTRAMQMVLGILILAGSAFLLSQLYPLTTLKWFMDKFYSSIIIIIVILFQEDIRQVLSRMGKKSFKSSGGVSSRQILDEITRAATSLAEKGIGALIVIEKNIVLTRYVDIGIQLDSRISKEIILSIFHTSSPIHDGAIIIQKGRIASAGSFLPLTRDEKTDPNLGTRHRAAIGISQETDAVVLVISEERATISLVFDGEVSRDLESRELRKALRNILTGNLQLLTGEFSQNTSEYPSVLGKMKIFSNPPKNKTS